MGVCGAFLAGEWAVVLVNGDVLKPAIAFQILDALPPGLHHEQNLVVGQILELAVVFRRLDDNFVRAHRLHLVIDSVGAPFGISLNAIERVRVREYRDLRRTLRRQAKKGVPGIRFLGTKRTAARGFAGVFPVSHDHPTARDGIFTKFHEKILSQGGGLQKDSFGRGKRIQENVAPASRRHLCDGWRAEKSPARRPRYENP